LVLYLETWNVNQSVSTLKTKRFLIGCRFLCSSDFGEHAKPGEAVRAVKLIPVLPIKSSLKMDVKRCRMACHTETGYGFFGMILCAIAQNRMNPYCHPYKAHAAQKTDEWACLFIGGYNKVSIFLAR